MIDFEAYHRETLPGRLTSDAVCTAVPLLRRVGSLAIRLREGGAWTYAAGEGGLELRPGEDADTVVEVDHETWCGIVRELEAPAGLLYAGRVKCVRGTAINLVNAEPALRALYNDRPVYDPRSMDLRDRRGAPLDPESTFSAESDPEEMAHFLRTAGYLFVRDVFSQDEVAYFLAEASELHGEAVKGDKLSWWGKNEAGEEVLCRVTRAGAKPHLASIPEDPRLLRFKDLADVELASRRRTGEESISIIWKIPEMTEGLADIPWHRDCGMGGHAAMCPVLIASVFLTEATPETGELEMLPGSWQSGCGPIDPNHPQAPKGAHFHAHPGDVSLHYGDTMHAAPPPRPGLAGYRVSAVTGYARPGAHHHRGEKNYNVVLHGREDGQVENLEKVARRA